MPTKNQLIRHGREEKRRTDRTRASDQWHMARKGNPISVRHLRSYSFYFFGVIVIIAIAAVVVDISGIVTDQVRQALLEVILSLLQYGSIYVGTLIEEMVAAWRGQERCATMGTGGVESPSRSEEETYKAPHVNLMLSSDSDSVNQGGGGNVPPLTIDLNRPAQDQEYIRQYAEEIKNYRIDEQFENFKNDEFTKQLYDQLCAHVGDADAVKSECIAEISGNFHSTDAGLIDFVKQTDDNEGQRRVILDLIELHFRDELDKLPPELQQNENQEEE